MGTTNTIPGLDQYENFVAKTVLPLLESGTLLPPTTIRTDASYVAYKLGWKYDSVSQKWYKVVPRLPPKQRKSRHRK